MCGGGSLLLHGAMHSAGCRPADPARGPLACLGGEQDLTAARTAAANVDALRASLPTPAAGVARWDVRELPVRDASVDVVLCDLPFGKRCGTKWNNQKLYPQVLAELARVLRPGTGRAALLGLTSGPLERSLSRPGVAPYWDVSVRRGINHGGMYVSIIVLRRTAAAHSYSRAQREAQGARAKPKCLKCGSRAHWAAGCNRPRLVDAVFKARYGRAARHRPRWLRDGAVPKEEWDRLQKARAGQRAAAPEEA